MTFHDDELDDFLKEKLKLLEPTQTRDPENARLGRTDYIQQVNHLQYGKSRAPFTRLFKRKPWLNLASQRPSLVPLAAACLIIITLLLGTGGTVYAAQGSLPSDLLYPVKLAGEKLQLAFTPDPNARITLLITYADRRVDEATTLVLRGSPVPEELPALMGTHLDELFTTIANLDNASAEETIKGIQIHLRDQDQAMSNLMSGLPEGLEPGLAQLQAMVQARQQFIHTVMGTPDTSNNQPQFNSKEGETTAPVTATITTTLAIMTTKEITPTVTITPGHYGPGPCVGDVPENCDPAGYQDPFGPFKGTPPDQEDPRGYGPGSDDSEVPQQPVETTKSKGPEQPKETPIPGKDDSDGKNEGDSGENNDSGKGGDEGNRGNP